MKLKKRSIKIIMGILTVGIWLAGCGNKETEEAEGMMQGHYDAAVENLIKKGILPDGQDAYVGHAEDAWPNHMALSDIDGDGKEELLLSIGGTCMADTCLYIFQYDEGSGEFRRELAVWPRVDFYTNGLVVEEASHNHGMSGNDDFWPYSVSCYDSDTDLYQTIFEVDGWEKEYRPTDYDGNAFPDEMDIDGDGFVYRITEKSEDELTILDNTDYEAWFENLIGDAGIIQIAFIELDTVN